MNEIGVEDGTVVDVLPFDVNGNITDNCLVDLSKLALELKESLAKEDGVPLGEADNVVLCNAAM